MTGIIALKEILADEVKLTAKLKNIASRFAKTDSFAMVSFKLKSWFGFIIEVKSTFLKWSH